MEKKSDFIPNPIIGITYEKDLHLFDTKRPFHAKDDVKALKHFASKFGKSRVTGEERKSYSDGFRVSAKCRPNFARGHNIRAPKWVDEKSHIDEKGFHKTYLDLGNLEQCYKTVFGKALEEYNSKQTRSDRKIKNYLQKILDDERRGTMKKSSKVDNSRKPVYEFIFQIGKRDNRLDTQKSIEILEKFVLEWMPSHYPNLHPVCITLHADEYTFDPITKQKLDGSVHVHFNYIPIAHCLTKEEQQKENEMRKELESKARTAAALRGETFDKKKFDKQDWQKWRVENFGKALQKGMSIQSSMTGACAEMGFRTKGKLTAQIQMEEAVRQDLLDFAESYGVKVNREVAEKREETVSIDEYKSREDNKRVLSETIRLNKINSEIAKRNDKKSEMLFLRETKINKENDKLEKFSTVLESRQDEIDEEKNALIILSEELKEQKKIEDEKAKENERIAKQNEINSKMINQKIEEFKKLEEKYNRLTSFFETKDKIDIDMKDVENQVTEYFLDRNLTWRESVQKAIDYTVKKFYNIAHRCQKGIAAFNNFLKGKTPTEIRNLADDMERTNSETFEDYEKKWMSKQLDWQVKNGENEQKSSITIEDIER